MKFAEAFNILLQFCVDMKKFHVREKELNKIVYISVTIGSYIVYLDLEIISY